MVLCGVKGERKGTYQGEGILQYGILARRAFTGRFHLGRTVGVGESVAFTKVEEGRRNGQGTILYRAFADGHHIEARRLLLNGLRVSGSQEGRDGENGRGLHFQSL